MAAAPAAPAPAVVPCVTPAAARRPSRTILVAPHQQLTENFRPIEAASGGHARVAAAGAPQSPAAVAGFSSSELAAAVKGSQTAQLSFADIQPAAAAAPPPVPARAAPAPQRLEDEHWEVLRGSLEEDFMAEARRALGHSLQEPAILCTAEVAALLRASMRERLGARNGQLSLRLGTVATAVIVERALMLHSDVVDRAMEEARAERERLLGVRST